MTRNRSLDVTRRGLIGGSSAMLGLGAGLLPHHALAQGAPTPIDVLLVNATVQGELRTILEQEANVRLTDGPWQSSTDVVSRVTAPGGTSRWDLVSSTFDFSRPILMGARAGRSGCARSISR